MNCDETRRHWNLYHDSEGDAELHLRINEHLEACPACAEWFFKQSQLEDAISRKLGAVSPSPRLWASVLNRSGVLHAKQARQTWLLSGLLILAASIMLAVGFWSFRRIHDAADLTKLTAQWHEQAAAGKARVEFASTSDLEIEAYLRGRVGFPVRCPPRQDAGFHVNGAGMCRLAGNEAAYLVGQVAETPVSIFILPTESLANFPHQQTILQREAVHRCREGNSEMVMGRVDLNVVLVIGRTESARLAKVLSAYGTYPDDHSG